MRDSFFACFVLFFFFTLLRAVEDERIKEMSIMDLKKFLERKGVPCKDCVQKEDFIEIALSVKDHSDVETKSDYNQASNEASDNRSSTDEHKNTKSGKSSGAAFEYDMESIAKLAEEYLAVAKDAAVESWKVSSALAAEYGKIYGPKVQKAVQVYGRLAQEQGIKWGRLAWEKAQIYGQEGIKQGRIYGKKALQQIQLWSQAAMKAFDDFLAERAKKTKQEL